MDKDYDLNELECKIRFCAIGASKDTDFDERTQGSSLHKFNSKKEEIEEIKVKYEKLFRV